MLMDRKRINRWTRWFAIILAAVFALGTVFLGVGSKTGNLFSGCSKSITRLDHFHRARSRTGKPTTRTRSTRIRRTTDSMLALANLYADQTVGRYDDAIIWLQQGPGDRSRTMSTSVMLIGKAYMNKGRTMRQRSRLLTQVHDQWLPTTLNAFLLWARRPRLPARTRRPSSPGPNIWS